MPGLGFVAAVRQRHQDPGPEQSHPVLRVPNRAAGDELEEPLGSAVGEPSRGGHRSEVGEPVADHQVGLAARREEARDCRRGMLPVGVDQQHGARRRRIREQVFHAGADGRAFATALREPNQCHPIRGRDGLEPPRALVVRPVVHDDERADVLEHPLDKRTRGHVAVRGHHRGDSRCAKRLIGILRRSGRPRPATGPLEHNRHQLCDRDSKDGPENGLVREVGAGACSALTHSDQD
jgi:hypothetical protein